VIFYIVSTPYIHTTGLEKILRKFGNMSGDIKCLKIGTHNGHFHCDEVLACFMLKLLPQYKNAEIVRLVIFSFHKPKMIFINRSVYSRILKTEDFY
jgi:hypothetical protein